MKASKKHIRKLLPFLQVLKELRPVQRNILLAHIDDKSCEMIYEAISNVLQNSKVSYGSRKRLKKALQPHKRCLRTLISKTCSRSRKRKYLTKIGGFPLGTILATAIPLLLNLFTRK